MQISQCQLCPRLRKYCLEIAKTKRKSYQAERYYAKPIEGFGDLKAKLLIVGLAPSAHGANRTGRMITGDESGKWLYQTLYDHGFSNQAQSINRNDNLKLNETYITCVVKCAPPSNKPSLQELNNCTHHHFQRELVSLKNLKVILCLGKIAYEQTFKQLVKLYGVDKKLKKPFQHGLEIEIELEIEIPTQKSAHKKITLLTSYHPSQQNTFTGVLTSSMFNEVFRAARQRVDLPQSLVPKA